jgi:hypothetical protein
MFIVEAVLRSFFELFYVLPGARRALEAAELATKFDPCRAKNWVRMGDAYRGLPAGPVGGWGGCALLCYEQAAQMAPQDAEIATRWAKWKICPGCFWLGDGMWVARWWVWLGVPGLGMPHPVAGLE